jgi:hypothetical protein
MNCEQRRNEGASPQSPSHLSQYEKQQDDSDGVQKNVAEMVPGRLQAVQLTIKHVRNGRERVPVTAYLVCKSPRDPFQRKACCNVCILINVLGIIVGDELMAQSLTENQPGDPGENRTNPEE